MSTFDEARAREAIRHTQSIYTTAGDRGRADEVATVFTPDGVLQFSTATHTGHDEIRAAFRSVTSGTTRVQAAGGPVFVRHNLTTSRIEFRSEHEADSWTYFMVMTPIGLDHSGVYVDKLVRVDDGWLIAHRRVKIDWTSPQTVMAAD